MLTASLQAAYESLQLHLDAHPDDQDARRVLADVLEDMGRPAAAECMRWMAEKNRKPRQDFLGRWLLGRDDNTRAVDSLLGCLLPGCVFEKLPKKKRAELLNCWCRWKRRRLAEEAALRAWEEWRRENPTGEPK